MNVLKMKGLVSLSLLLGAFCVYAQGDDSAIPDMSSEASVRSVLLDPTKRYYNFYTGNFGTDNVSDTFQLSPSYLRPSPTDSISVLDNFNFGAGGSGLGLKYRDARGVPCMLQVTPSMSCFTGSGIQEQHFTTEKKLETFNSQNGDEVVFSDYMCTPEYSDDSLMKAARDMNWGQCFEGRMSFTRDTDKTEKELLGKDQDICKCLRTWNKPEGVQEAMKETHNENAKEQAKAVPQQELNKILTGMMFQTMSITNNIEVAAKWGHNLYSSSNVPGQAKLEFVPSDELFKDKVPYPAGQCISPRHYFQFKQRPGRRVKEAMVGEFKNEDWNYKILQDKYTELMTFSLASREEKKDEIQTLKAKLKFLNRNPLIKYTLGSEDKSENFEKAKVQVLKALKMLKDDQECQSLESQCSKEYNNLLTSAFHSEGVMKTIRDEARLDHSDRIEARRKKDLLTKKGDVTQRSIVNQFMSKYNLPSPDVCESDAPKVECLTIYSNYCRTLDSYKDDIAALSEQHVDPDILDDLDDELNNEFNPDIATNENFRRFNDRHCNSPRSNGTRQASFDEFVSEFCKDSSNKGCSRASADDYSTLRASWVSAYPGTDIIQRRVASGTASDGEDAPDASFLSRFNSATSGTSVQEVASTDLERAIDDMKKEQSDEQLQTSATQRVIARGGFGRGDLKGDSLKEDKPAFLTGWGQAIADSMGVKAVPDSTPSYDNSAPFNYSNSYITPPSTATPAVADVPKVEQMTDASRQEMLGQWQKEYESWRESKGSELSPADAAKDTALRQEIATLRALLAQQQQLTEQQYKLLNEAIAKKSAPEQQAVAARAEERSEARKPSAFASARSSVSSEDDSEAVRGPASVKETKFNTSGATSGASTASVSSRRKSTSDSSSDSVAREEAKLVNMRRFSDGSITIESSGSNSAGATSAITVPVSDEQYRMLQSNPNSLNLNQIERSIPKDQIARLEKNGEIIILLRNGSNPPFEVKVEKKDNRLVYSLKDKNGNPQAPVRRVFTRQALELQLKAER